MRLLYVSGSPRGNSNTDFLINVTRQVIGGEFVKLAEHEIAPCRACRDCRGLRDCMIKDDMQTLIIPRLLDSDAIVLGTPVYFNNVSAQVKAFMDRTHCLMGTLRNKVGGAIVVGRGDGVEGAITAINAFFLKHEMLPANRGVSGFAFEQGEITTDARAREAAESLGRRVRELLSILKTG